MELLNRGALLLNVVYCVINVNKTMYKFIFSIISHVTVELNTDVTEGDFFSLFSLEVTSLKLLGTSRFPYNILVHLFAV
jgi:hypothetical protein